MIPKAIYHNEKEYSSLLAILLQKDMQMVVITAMHIILFGASIILAALNS